MATIFNIVVWTMWGAFAVGVLLCIRLAVEIAGMQFRMGMAAREPMRIVPTEPVFATSLPGTFEVDEPLEVELLTDDTLGDMAVTGAAELAELGVTVEEAQAASAVFAQMGGTGEIVDRLKVLGEETMERARETARQRRLDEQKADEYRGRRETVSERVRRTIYVAEDDPIGPFQRRRPR